MVRLCKRVAPEPSTDDFERDPPITCADGCIFMPVLVCQGLKRTLLDEQNGIRPFIVNGKLRKIHPTRFVSSMMLAPDHFGLPYENVYFRARDGVRLNGFLIGLDENRNRVPTIILFHGNSGNIGDNLTWATAMFEEILCNIFLFDYRGYGFSEGRPSERGAYWDAQAAFDYVCSRPDLNSSFIVLHGQSIGGAIALDLAVRKNYRHRIAGLVIENTFSSLSLLLRQYSQRRCLRPLRLIVKCFSIKGKFRNSKKISQVLCPTLVIASLKDQVIPPSHSSYLFDNSKSSRKRFYIDAEAGHMNAYLKDAYYQEIARFLIDVVMTEADPQEDRYSHPFAVTVRKSRVSMGPNVKRISD